MIFDLIIIGGGASGLFCAINAPKEYSKLILEKQDQLGTKILLSGGGRCNFSNINISPDKYFGKNKKMLASVFHQFNNEDMQEFLEVNGVQTKIEDNGRIILKSGKSKELLDLLIQKSKENNTEIKLNQEIIKIEKDGEIFIINTKTDEFKCNKLIIATGGVSFPNTGTNGYGIDLAGQLGLETTKPYPALCGIETYNNFELLSGSSTIAYLEIKYNKKTIYTQKGNILFTHWGLSGPVIFNTSAAIGEYVSKEGNKNDDYLNDFSINIKLEPENITKRMYQSHLISKNNEIICKIKAIRPLTEAKVSGGGISIEEIKPNFESTKIPNLYFIGETLDIIGETGGFNLQRAWSSGFVCGNSIKK